jgi:hypothetical protein
MCVISKPWQLLCSATAARLCQLLITGFATIHCYSAIPGNGGACWHEDPVPLTSSTAMAQASGPKALTNFLSHTPRFAGSPSLLIPTKKRPHCTHFHRSEGQMVAPLHHATDSMWFTHVVPVCCTLENLTRSICCCVAFEALFKRQNAVCVCLLAVRAEDSNTCVVVVWAPPTPSCHPHQFAPYSTVFAFCFCCCLAAHTTVRVGRLLCAWHGTMLRTGDPAETHCMMERLQPLMEPP